MDRPSRGQLGRTLGVFDATAVGIGAIIGAGIFVVTGIVAGLAGPALIISMGIAAIISLLTALSFVELTTWLPAEGSIYEFGSQLVSPFAGFLAGWMWIVSYVFVGPAVSLAFSYYFTALFPVVDLRLIAAIVCIMFTALNYVGAHHSAAFNNILVLAKVSILLAFSAVGLSHLNASNYRPFIPSGTGILYGAFFIFFAYTDFARIAVLGEEVKDARRVVPRAIILALVTSTAIYLLVGTVAVGLVGSERLGKSKSPLTEAISIVGNPALTSIVSLGGLFATGSVLLTSILGVSRMIFSMARKNDLPNFLSRLHSRYQTPHYSILIIGSVMTLLALFADLTAVVSVSIFASLFYYGLANLSALRMKIDSRLYPRAVPAAGLLSCLVLMFFVKASTLEVGAVCLLIGAIYYMVRNGPRKASALV
jgi:APA family basic amino acid/polyamine antiporter